MEGIIAYIKGELIPILPDSAKVIAGAMLLRNAGRAVDVAAKLFGTDMAKTLQIISDDGCIDVDIWAQNIKDAMHQFADGKLVIKLPILQPLTIVEADVDCLKRYIKGELR